MLRISYLCLALALLVGCSKSEAPYKPKEQILRFNIKSEPQTLDPRKATDVTSVTIIRLAFEGLTRLSPQGHPELAAAESVLVSQDKMSYLFTLRDAHWSDGRPVRAEDFATSWKQQLDPTFPGAAANDLFFIKNGKQAKSGLVPLEEVGVKAISDKELLVELEHPVSYLFSTLAGCHFYPIPTHLTSIDPHWAENNYVGNGPFMLTHRKIHEKMLFSQNPYYWDREAVTLKHLKFFCIEDELTELSMFENHELDWAGFPLSTLPPDAIPFLLTQGDLHVRDVAGVYYYLFNTTKYPFNNAKIRKALALAINRQELIDNITMTNQKPATTYTPPTLWSKSPPTSFQDYDLEKARKLFNEGLKELKISKEEFPALHLSYNTMAGHHKLAQAIQQQWKQALGIEVRLENKDWKVFLDELNSGQFHVARLGGLANVEDPITFLDSFRYPEGERNHTKWQNPTYTALLNKSDYEVDPKKREILLKQAETILLEEMPIIPLYFYTGAYLKAPYVKNVQISKLGDLDLKWAYVEIDD